jgi:hypothetical protein
MWSYLKPVAWLFLSKTGRQVGRLVVEFIYEAILQHPEWSDDERREWVVAEVIKRLAAVFPGKEGYIRFAVEYLVRVLRDRLRKLER